MILVKQVYALWNREVPVAAQKDIYDAWWQMMADLDLQNATDALTALSVLDGPMPRPGQLRRYTITRTGTNLPPTPIEAWNQLRSTAEAVNSGTFRPTVLHAAVAETIRLTGTNLHTNGDREQFFKTYDAVCERWIVEAFSP